jgi:MFS family permease
MRTLVASAALVFLGGYAVMVLEIVGARFLARDFGGSFYVWVSQIGVILTALALGYFIGGALADRWQRLAWLAWLLVPAGAFTFLIPSFAKLVLDAIVLRHPPHQAIPLFWQKVDPAIGSALIFLLPCSALAVLSPYLIRLAALRLTHVGRIAGLIHAASTVGGIGGVFLSGYWLIEHFSVSTIFRAMGGLTAGLGLACLFLDGWFRQNPPTKAPL